MEKQTKHTPEQIEVNEDAAVFNSFYITIDKEPIKESPALDGQYAARLQTAYNNTYGKGIDPEAVPDMLTALERIAEGDTATKSNEAIATQAIRKATKEVK